MYLPLLPIWPFIDPSYLQQKYVCTGSKHTKRIRSLVPIFSNIWTSFNLSLEFLNSYVFVKALHEFIEFALTLTFMLLLMDLSTLCSNLTLRLHLFTKMPNELRSRRTYVILLTLLPNVLEYFSV